MFTLKVQLMLRTTYIIQGSCLKTGTRSPEPWFARRQPKFPTRNSHGRLKLMIVMPTSSERMTKFPAYPALVKQKWKYKTLVFGHRPKDVKQLQNKFGCTLFAELRSQDMQTLPRIFRLFWIPKKFALISVHPKKYLLTFNKVKVFK